MKITVEFANLDEFKQYMGIESPSQLVQAPKEAADDPAPAPADTRRNVNTRTFELHQRPLPRYYAVGNASDG